MGLGAADPFAAWVLLLVEELDGVPLPEGMNEPQEQAMVRNTRKKDPKDNITFLLGFIHFSF